MVWINIQNGKLDTIEVCGIPLLKVEDSQGHPSLDYRLRNEYITAPEVAKKLDIGQTQVRQRATFSDLEAIKIANKWFFPKGQFNKKGITKGNR